MIHAIRRLLAVGMVVFTALLLVAPPIAKALSPAQLRVFQEHVGYFDVDPCGVAAGSAADSADSADVTADPSLIGSVYILGDSLSVRAKDDLDSAFQAKNISTFINASTSRSITKPGTDSGFKTSGLEAIAGDKARVKSAGAIVIALGTNQRDANFKSSVQDLIDAITKPVKGQPALNADAKIYWVNVFSEGKGANKVDRTAINKTIDDLSSTAGFAVIDTVDKGIEVDPSDNVHETIGKGTQQFAKIVADGVRSATPVAKSVASCSCNSDSSSSVSLSGKNNKEKIFNYLVNTAHFTPAQAAGIMGNMQDESGFEPQRQQGIFDHLVTPDNFTDPDGRTGYGLVQWTPGEKLINTFHPKSQAGDLGNQLKFLQDQLEGKGTIPAKAAGDKLRATTTPEDAASVFEKYYEIHDGPPQPHRLQNAHDIFGEFASGSSGGGGASSDLIGCLTSDTASGEVTGEYSLPVEKKFYTANKEWFTKPHHDYPAADIPVTSGNKVFAVGKGKVSSLAASGFGGGAGTHVFVTDGNITYGYFHGTPGSLKVAVGDDIKPGQLLMLSDNSGHSTGAHLHFQIEVSGTKVCPQNLLVAIGDGTKPPPIASLPKSGCTN